MMRHMTNHDKVKEFHTTFECGVDDQLVDKDVCMRIDLISEEFLEARDAMLQLAFRLSHGLPDGLIQEAVAEVRKELTDLLYVVYGTQVKFGWDGDLDFTKVHANNMSKVGPDGQVMRREDGKILKPEGFKKLDPMELLND